MQIIYPVNHCSSKCKLPNWAVEEKTLVLKGVASISIGSWRTACEVGVARSARANPHIHGYHVAQTRWPCFTAVNNIQESVGSAGASSGRSHKESSKACKASNAACAEPADSLVRICVAV